jgi:hypothetical protein
MAVGASDVSILPYYLTSLVDSRNSCTCTGKGNIQREEQAALKQKAMKPSQVIRVITDNLAVVIDVSWNCSLRPREVDWAKASIPIVYESMISAG